MSTAFTCEYAGRAMPDIAGFGILSSFSGQAGLSLILGFTAFTASQYWRNERKRGAPMGARRQREERRVRHVCRALAAGNDVQLLLGIAYATTAFIKRRDYGMYHLRLIYDTVSFIGVSSTTTLLCTAFCLTHLQRKMTYHNIRRVMIGGYLLAYMALSVMVVIQLTRWQDGAYREARCYRTKISAIASHEHPQADIVYVASTAFALFLTMVSAAFTEHHRHAWRVFGLLLVASGHYVVHFYFVVAVRRENQAIVAAVAPDKEDYWDFGQTTALLLLVLAFLKVGQVMWEFSHFGKPRADERDAELGEEHTIPELLEVMPPDEMPEDEMSPNEIAPPPPVAHTRESGMSA